jgi:hypothetical protein
VPGDEIEFIPLPEKPPLPQAGLAVPAGLSPDPKK